MKKFLFFYIFIFFTNLFAIELDKLKNYFLNYNKKYIIYILKKEKKLYLIDEKYKIIKEYKIATGLNEGPKLCEGDNKTPEGEYKITKILSYKRIKNISDIEFEKNKKELQRMNGIYLKAKDGHKKFGTDEDLGYNSYGPVFIRLNYPEEEDKKIFKEAKKKRLIAEDKKIGSGIAIHGTNDDASLGHNSSSGCIRMNNNDIEELLDFIEKGMKVIIEP